MIFLLFKDNVVDDVDDFYGEGIGVSLDRIYVMV